MDRPRLYYTFGNHMHWVDMQWLWGYHVLPGSVRDMIRLCREAGVKGNVNFDGVGYEKLASEDPEAFGELREAVRAGMVEVVGASYGQPYGQFHGGESNVRQRVYGVRTAMRLFGVRPVTFWEEEFDFFPQLPQMLRRCGYRYGSLFFQWTWHTPELPVEEVPVVQWEAPDGSSILASTRNRLNLHQWPEDMELTFQDLAANPPSGSPLVLQWLELMPSPDWMCRSEVILPKLKELLADPRFEVVPVTLGEYLEEVARGTGVPPVVSSGVSPESARSAESTEDGRDAGFPEHGRDGHGNHGRDARATNFPVFRGTPVASQYRRRQGAYLPHLSADGATYAVSFRLHDALPREVREAYAAERDRLRKLVESGVLLTTIAAFEYQRLHQEKVETALRAGHGSCLMRDPDNASIVEEALLHFHEDRYELIAWCVMPNHVHALLRPLGSHELADILHSWKSFTAHAINKRLTRTGTVWQEEYYDHLIRSDEDFAKQIEYILDNPRRSHLENWDFVGFMGQGTSSVERTKDRGTGVPPVVSSGVSPESARSAVGMGARRDAKFPEHGRDGHGDHGRDARATGMPPVRRYHPDQTWHGLSVGKNGDQMRRLSHRVERQILSAEALSATLGLFGRPYAQWDVYPTWELEEAWRELLQAQHHDNDECEGLCGRVGVASYDRAEALSSNIRELNANLLSNRLPSAEGMFLLNPLPWSRTVGEASLGGTFTSVPPTQLGGLGWTIIGDSWRTLGSASARLPEGVQVRGGQVIDWDSEELGKVFATAFPEAEVSSGGQRHAVRPEDPEEPDEWDAQGDEPPSFSADWQPSREGPGLELTVRHGSITFQPDPGFGGAWRMPFPLAFRPAHVFSDAPYSIFEVGAGSQGRRKYPEGDWMTSPQWFEDVEGAFTSLSFVDLVREDGTGLLVCHDGSLQWFRRPDGQVEVVLGLLDPWDETEATADFSARFRLIPHGPWSNADRWRRAQEFRCPVEVHAVVGPAGDLPAAFSPFRVEAGLTATAFYRETEDFSGRGLESYAGRGMGYPYVLRLVELDGEAGEAQVSLAAHVARALKTNLMGEAEEALAAEGGVVRVPYGPFEIVTLYLDLEEGRKQTRDLDAKREIWATVHRT